MGTTTLRTVHLGRRAMATHFELWLVGEDSEHLEAVGHAALAEVTRIEALLSRFDPASEIARVNRDAVRNAVRVDVELFGILQDCRRRWEETNGYFDVCAPGRSAGGAGKPASMGAAIEVDSEGRTVRFKEGSVRLDLGGYGKGYALDAVRRVLDEYGVDSAFVHGGTSSILALGERASGAPWRVGVRNPFLPEQDVALATLALRDVGFSSSAVSNGSSVLSNIVDPHTGVPLAEQAACAVIAPAALDAEVWSTALLAMGREGAARLLRESGEWPGERRVAWIERTEEEVRAVWLNDD